MPTAELFENRPPGRSVLFYLANNFYCQFTSLMLFALVLNREGDRVPAGDELVYLLYFFKAFHRPLLAADWTFQEITAGHGFFNYATGWVTLLMPLEAGAWVGRVACWGACFLGLLRVGRHYLVPPWAVWLGVLLYLIQHQGAPITAWGDWMVGCFEAKCPAYACVLFSIDALVRSRPLRAGLLMGLAFSFHSAVGLWAGLALGWAAMLNLPGRATLRYSAGAVAASLPGLISSLPLVLGPHAIGPDDARFLVTVALPQCCDVFAYSQPYVVLIALMLVFGFVHQRANKADRGVSILFQFEFATALFFAAAYGARAAGRFDFLKLYPMRVFAVFVLPLFFWQLASVLLAFGSQPAVARRRASYAAAAGLILFLALPSPVAQLGELIALHFHNTHPPGDGVADDESTADFRTAADWVQRNTPVDALVIAPPWRADAFYFLRRPLVANWHAYRYYQMGQWRARIESLAGPLWQMDTHDPRVGDMDRRARDHYRSLSPADVQALQRQYAATWLVTTTKYPFSLAASAGDWKVYRLPK